MKTACLWFSDSVETTKVAELCLRFSPQVAVSPHAVFVEIGKCRHLYSVPGFLARVHVLLRRLNLKARVAVGADICDSLAFAKYGVSSVEVLPLNSLLDFADPFEQDPVLRKYVVKMIAAFSDLGITNIGAFQKLPLSDLVSRFGPVAVLTRQRTSLESPHAWPYFKPAEIIIEKTDFPYFEFYGELEPILFELKKQLDSVFQRLWARELRAQKMQVRLFLEKNSLNPKPYRQFDFDFLFPQSVTKGALNIIKERLMRDFENEPVMTPLEGLETKVTATVPGVRGQKNLLHRFDEISEQQQALLGQLTEMLGKENIFFAELTEDRRPEFSWKKSEKSVPCKASLHLPLRPTHLIAPESVSVAAGFLHYRNSRYRIRNWSDQHERITGGWQENPLDFLNSYDRRYHRVDLENGISLSVFQNPAGEFFLQGYFG